MQTLVLELGSKGYSCAQIVVLAGLRLMGRENPDLVRAMAGLAQGVGCSGEICGALAGGVCLIAMHTAKGQDQELVQPEGIVIMNELIEWFRQELSKDGLLTCDALLSSGVNQPRTMEPILCGKLVEQVLNKSLQLLIANQIDPSQGRED